MVIATFVNVHLCLICNLIGSRGSNPEDFWAIYYLALFDTHFAIVWIGQWLLDIENTSIALILTAISLTIVHLKVILPLI